MTILNKTFLTSLSIGLLFFLTNFSTNAQNEFFDCTNSFFSEHVKSGKVDYATIAQDRTDLDKLVEMVATYTSISAEKDLPFYLNAYNILVIKSVVDNYPIASPMDVPNFFDEITHNVDGQKLTLNGIENDVIRPTYGDARIHFALVCAAKGCPKLKSKAFTSSNYKIILAANTKAAMNDDTFTKVDDANKTIHLSKIFEWYKVDFGSSDLDLINFVNQYREKPIPEDYKVLYYEYDWSLNAQ